MAAAPPLRRGGPAAIADQARCGLLDDDAAAGAAGRAAASAAVAGRVAAGAAVAGRVAASATLATRRGRGRAGGSGLARADRVAAVVLEVVRDGRVADAERVRVGGVARRYVADRRLLLVARIAGAK